MKIVAVSQHVDSCHERDENRDRLDQNLSTFLLEAESLPVPVPNVLNDKINDWLTVVRPAAIVLSGGNDIGQCPKRDKTEFALLAYAQEYRLPVLGICRGMQMLAYRFGAKLHSVRGHVRTRHRLSGEISNEVNSYHSFSLTGCPADFKVIARSEDGEIEAIRHHVLPWEGWMWHPEREANFTESDIQRLKILFS